MLTKDSAKDLLKKAEEFVVQLKLIISSLKNEEIDDFRKRFYNL